MPTFERSGLYSFAQQRLHFYLQRAEFGLNDIPGDVVLDHPITVYELVAKADYATPFIDPFCA